MKKEQLRKKFQVLEQSKAQILADLVGTDESILYRKPAEGKWNIAQIFYHLNLAEAGSMNYVKKKMLGGSNLKKTGAKAFFRSMFLKWLLQSGYKWKAPKVLGDVPDQVNYAQVVASWKKTRTNLYELIDSIPDDLIGREVYRHPRGGRLNLVHMLQFFQDHFDHHRLQVIRLKEMTP